MALMRVSSNFGVLENLSLNGVYTVYNILVKIIMHWINDTISVLIDTEALFNSWFEINYKLNINIRKLKCYLILIKNYKFFSSST